MFAVTLFASSLRRFPLHLRSSSTFRRPCTRFLVCWVVLLIYLSVYIWVRVVHIGNRVVQHDSCASQRYPGVDRADFAGMFSSELSP